MKLPLHNLILDLETTGLDEKVDEILELAVIGTDIELSPIFEFTWVIQTPDLRATLARIDANPYLSKLHRETGLVRDLASESTVSLAHVENVLVQVVQSTSEKVILSGSGVSHFDQRFLKVNMPALHSRLAHFTIDVGIMRRAYKDWVGVDLVDANEQKTHRALDDVRCHLDEARAFRKFFLAGKQVAA